MIIKSIKVTRSIEKIAKHLYEARLKRKISITGEIYYNIPTKDIISLEKNGCNVPYKTFLRYVVHLNLFDSIISLIEEKNNDIYFVCCPIPHIKTLCREDRSIHKLITMIKYIKEYRNISNDEIIGKTGLTNQKIYDIENEKEDNVTLYEFLLYCKIINILDSFVESLSFKYDEYGNMLVMRLLESQEL